MPDVSYSILGQVQKGALSQAFSANGITADIATAGVLSVTLALDTNTTQITTTSLGALGLCFARSLATTTTHTVSIGRLVSNTLHDVVRLKAGEAAVLRLAPGNYAAKAAVAGTTRVVVTIYED
jgi:hypothetical protein